MEKRSGRTILSQERRPALDRARAEEIGMAALGFLAEEPQRLGRFLSLTGIDPGDLRAEAGEPHMLAALLDHLLSDETLLLVFTSEKRIAPEDVGPSQLLLSGGTHE